MGFWTNGSQTFAIYKRHSADWVEVANAKLPQPSDDLTQAPDTPPTWNSLKVPAEAELSAVLRRIVATVVVSDPNVNRREEQLRELLHILLVKLESDAVYSRKAYADRG
jgi:type I restriction enzyme M protein